MGGGGRNQAADPKEKEILSSSRFFCLQTAHEKRGGEKGGQKCQQWGEGTTVGYSRSQIYAQIATAPLQGVHCAHSPSDKRDSEQRDNASLWKPSLIPTSYKQGAILTGSPPFHKGCSPDNRCIQQGRRDASADLQ